VLLCFEVDRPALAREVVAAGARTVLVLSNDAQLPPQAITGDVAQARLRAVETGAPVVRAANAGTSLAIDRFGRIVQQSRGGVLNVSVPAAAVAPANRWAQPFLGLCWLVSVAGTAGAWWRQ
jgi:apolipoprotein N-acyltransferase